MDYHSDRFHDCSLMIYRRGILFALLPASVHGKEVRSHGGLTYGGLIMSKKATAEDILAVFELIISYYSARGFLRIIYKPLPHIYHDIPAEEDLYALFRVGASIIGRDVSACILSSDRIKMRNIRKAGVRKALAAGVSIMETNDFSPFWEVLDNNLVEKYGTLPVHSLTEIHLLHDRFPKQIRLHVACQDGECLAGAVVFLSKNVAHVQYISASHHGKKIGALDLLFSSLINETYSDVKYFDFGKSTEGDGSILNSALMYQKEGFGARSIVYDTYMVPI